MLLDFSIVSTTHWNGHIIVKAINQGTTRGTFLTKFLKLRLLVHVKYLLVDTDELVIIIKKFLQYLIDIFLFSPKKDENTVSETNKTSRKIRQSCQHHKRKQCVIVFY